MIFPLSSFYSFRDLSVHSSCCYNREEGYGRVLWLSDTLYSGKGSKREMEIYKQQSEIVKRRLHAFLIHGNVGGRQI